MNIHFRARSGQTLVMNVDYLRYSRLRRRVRAWCESEQRQSHRGILYMITLTYRDCDGWRPLHISRFMTLLRQRLKSSLLSYVWVAEVQKRGAIHYHVLIRSLKHPGFPDRDRLWEHGLSRVDVARTPYYILSYVGKEYQKDFSLYPRGCRLFAVWIQDRVLVDCLRYLSLPLRVRRVCDVVGVRDYRVACMVKDVMSLRDGWVFLGVSP